MTLKHLAAIALCALIAGPVLAQHEGHSAPDEGTITASGAYLRATLPRAPVGGGYVTLTNTGSEDDRLIAVSAPVGESADIHEMAHENGQMTMRPLPDGLSIAAGETVVLEPGGLHLMLNGLRAPLVEGDSLDLVLSFEKAGDMTVTFDILAINATMSPGAEEAAHDDHGAEAGTDDGHGH